VGAAEHRGDLTELFLDVFAVGLGEDGADIEATISCDPFGTTARTLRMKCTRQRCQPAPWNTVPMAFFSPVCASDITSFTPSRPRVFNDRRNAVQKPSFSLSPTSKPSTSRRPSAATPTATTMAWATMRCPTLALQ
jgi:hypothetical protein